MAFLALLFLGFWPLAHFLPGHDPSASATTIASIYRANTLGLRVGAVCMLFGTGLYLPFIVTVSAFIQRMERGSTFLSQLQLTGGTAAAIFLFLPAMFWGVTAFRPERAPDLTLLLNDTSWLLFITPVPPFLLQTLPLAAVILLSTEQPLLPRWFAFLTILEDLILLPAMLAYFFHSGPFAWNGLFPYWLAIFGYGGWLVLAAILMVRVINKENAGLLRIDPPA